MNIFLGTKMLGTPFTDSHSLQILRQSNWCITETITEAEVVVAHNYKKLLPYIIRYPKKRYIVWTNEPRFDTTFIDELKLPFGFPTIQIMNIYGKEVFWHNFHYLSSYHYNHRHNLGIDINTSLNAFTKHRLQSSGKKNKIAALFTYNIPLKNKLIKEKTNIDLSQKRCQYAIAGHKRNLVDIYGNNWPQGYAIGNSGFGFDKEHPWWVEKIRILNGYKFNLCFENTAHQHYVTEKIWHAIVSYTLPIYNSFNSSIYKTFPKNSFLDANLFKDEHVMFDYIQAMHTDEYLERLNSCIDAFNISLKIKRENYNMYSNEIAKKIIERLNN